MGVDLGQSHDYTAVSVVERAELRGEWALRLRHLERVELGTPYPDVVARVTAVTQGRALAGRCELVVDGTGVGRPVVDLLRRARPGCGILPVVVTAGDRERCEGGYWRVPKRDLMVRMQVMFQKGELQIARGLKWGPALAAEMTAMQVKVTASGREQYGCWREGTHDDLVFAVALACWGRRRVGAGWGYEERGGMKLLVTAMV